MAGEIGKVRLGRLLAYFKDPDGIFSSNCDELAAVCGVSRNLAARIVGFKKKDLDKEFSCAKKLGLRVITLDDPEYPGNLKNIFSPPIVLYVKGRIEAGDQRSVAIVGSRHASFYGLAQAEKFAFELAERRFTVVSGMARGIDTSAHKGALKACGRTIAAIGSGFKHIYPEENRSLAERIAENGAVISEFPLDACPLRENFPRRNRIISGLSLGTLVVEAAQNSGALITADFALEQGREVFSIPGKIDSAYSFGTNALIKQGAKLVSNTDEIIEEFGFAGGFRAQASVEPVNETGCEASLSGKEQGFWRLIKNEPVHFDRLVDETRLDITRVSDILLSLRLKKLIRELPGKFYIRTK